jgi:hypothetical protein
MPQELPVLDDRKVQRAATLKTAKSPVVLRSLTDEVRLIPENGRLEIELAGNLPAMLAFANGTPRRAGPAGG